MGKKRPPSSAEGISMPDELASFIEVAKAWLKGIPDALYGPKPGRAGGRAVSRIIRLAALKDHHLPWFRKRQAELILLAHKKGMSEKIEPLLRDVKTLLLDRPALMRGALITYVTAHSRHAPAFRDAGPVAHIERLLDELELLGPLLGGARTPEHLRSGAVDGGPILHADDAAILEHLQRSRTKVIQAHIAKAIQRDLKTVGKRLKRLRDLGFTHREGDRGGDAITQVGRGWLEERHSG